jgi:hypothetical protein
MGFGTAEIQSFRDFSLRLECLMVIVITNPYPIPVRVSKGQNVFIIHISCLVLRFLFFQVS